MRKESKLLTCCFCSDDKTTQFWIHMQWFPEVYSPPIHFKELWLEEFPQTKKKAMGSIPSTLVCSLHVCVVFFSGGFGFLVLPKLQHFRLSIQLAFCCATRVYNEKIKHSLFYSILFYSVLFYSILFWYCLQSHFPSNLENLAKSPPRLIIWVKCGCKVH